MPDTQSTRIDPLRQTARLLRERAELATPGPWEENMYPDGAVFIDRIGLDDDDTGDEVATFKRPGDAAHSAALTPEVAIELASWLDVLADSREAHLELLGASVAGMPARTEADLDRLYRHPLALARAYLCGETL